MKIKDQSIDKIGLSVRCKNALHNNHIDTLGQMMKLTPEQLYLVRNLGAKSVEEILAKCKEYSGYGEDEELPNDMPTDSQPSGAQISTELKEKYDCQSILSVGLSVRSTNALLNAKINTVWQMLNLTDEKLGQMRNIGEKSIAEVMEAISRLINQPISADTQEEKSKNRLLSLPASADDFLAMSSSREKIGEILLHENKSIDELALLTPRAYNLLIFSGFSMLHQVLFLDVDTIMSIPRMDRESASAIQLACEEYLNQNKDRFYTKYIQTLTEVTAYELRLKPEYRLRMQKFVQVNDLSISQMGISARGVKLLQRLGYRKLSDLFFFDTDESSRRLVGTDIAKEISQAIKAYCEANEDRIITVCGGDESAVFSDETIRNLILKLYQEKWFYGYSLNEILECLELPEPVSVTRVKKIIGGLLADKKIEYVDYRCYRTYDRFEDVIDDCPKIGEREKRILHQRMKDFTLEQIAKTEGNLTRERIRQIIDKNGQQVITWYQQYSGRSCFDEDYYRYLFENYAFDRDDATEWLGIPRSVFCYFGLVNVKQGNKSLNEALVDSENIEAGMRLKIQNYINRNKLFIDGIWVEKKRVALEEMAVRKFCRNNISFDDFIGIYNQFLLDSGVSTTEDLFITDATRKTREHALTESRSLLWKQNRLMRYYDIDSRDYTELLDVLNLDTYENIDLSTQKWLEEYPELMHQYDIRDQYELHNLLRKIVVEGAYHEICFSKMPNVSFGRFDRDAAMLQIMTIHAPIHIDKLAELIHQEYGYDLALIKSTYLRCLDPYYHQGMYNVNQKQPSEYNWQRLQEALTDDFYYVDEIRKIYTSLIPDGNADEINAFTLKKMGFIVLCRYAVRNHPSLEAYFVHLLTEKEKVNIRNYRSRFSGIQAFYGVLTSLKKELRIVEFLPDQFISFDYLEKKGLTTKDAKQFCDAVWSFTSEDTFFSISSLKQDGFDSPLFEFGFSDFFYANLLKTDSRFANSNAFGTIILIKGRRECSIRTFEVSLICSEKMIDVYDLMSKMTERYGCKITDRADIIYKVQGTDVYYDQYTDRLYMTYDEYEHDLDRAEELIHGC